MNVGSFIAKRYLFSKKSSNAVNVISWISVISIAIATFALVTVLSAFNGLQDLVESLYEEFEPDVMISPASGKFFDRGALDYEQLASISGVESIHPVLEDLTLVRYDKQQSPCTIKGIEEEFLSASGLRDNIYEGSHELTLNGFPTAIVGYGLASILSVNVRNPVQSLKLYAPKLSSTNILNPASAFYTKSISPTGVFMVNPDIDNKYLIVPLDFAGELLAKKGKLSAVEIKVEEGQENTVKAAVQNLVGDTYEVETRFELNKLIYQTNQSEKVVTFFILLFILIIAAFNVISSLTMILLEKEKDIRTLRVLGFDVSGLRGIFIREGLYINSIGIGIGMSLGIIICLLQIYVGLVSLEGGIVDYYPVNIEILDMVLILISAMLIGLVASYFPSRLLIKGNAYDKVSAAV